MVAEICGLLLDHQKPFHRVLGRLIDCQSNEIGSLVQKALNEEGRHKKINGSSSLLASQSGDLGFHLKLVFSLRHDNLVATVVPNS